MDNQTNISTQSSGDSNQLPEGYTVSSTPFQAPAQSNTSQQSELPDGYTIGSTPFQNGKPQTGMQKVTGGLEAQTGSDWDSPILGNTISGAVKSAAGGLGNILDMVNHALSPNSNVNNPITQSDKVRAQSIAQSYQSAHPTATPEQVSQYVNQKSTQGLSTHVQSAADWLRSAGQPSGFWQNVGALGEQTVELLGLDGLSKLITVPAKAAEGVAVIDSAQHAAQLSKVATVLQNNPKIAGLVAVGLQASKDAVMMGGQTYAHTEDAGQAVTSGLVGGAVGGVVGGIGAIASSVLEKGGQAAEDVNSIRNAAQNAPTANAVERQLDSRVKGALQPTSDAAQNAIDNANNVLDEAQQTQGTLAYNAPSNEQITNAAKQQVQNVHANLMTEYGNGMDTLKKIAQGQTLDYAGSPLQQAAQSLLKQGSEESKTLDTAFDVNRPGSDGANKMLDLLANPEKIPVKGTEPTPTLYDASGNAINMNPQAPSIQMGMQELVDRRKQIGELLRKTGWQTDEQLSDRDIYKTLLQGTDDSIQKLLAQTGNPEAISTLQNMNNNYRTGIQRFDNTDIQAILKGNSDSVQKRMLAGNTSIADINNLRDTVGKGTFQLLSDDMAQRFAADSISPKTGALDFSNLLTKWNAIDPAKRDALFGSSMNAEFLENAIKAVQNVTGSEVIPQSEQIIKDTSKQIADILGNGNIDNLLKDTTRVKNLSSLIGPDAMGELGKSVLQNKLREASTNVYGSVGNIDTKKFLSFVDSLKNAPEVRNALFPDTTDAANAYKQAIAKVKNIDTAKFFTKLGIGAGLTGTVGAAGSLVGHALMAMALTGGAEAGAVKLVPRASSFLDELANSKQAWGILSGLNSIAKSPGTRAAGKAAKYAAGLTAGKAASWVNSTKSSLSGQ
jgi:hypothetical protein